MTAADARPAEVAFRDEKPIQRITPARWKYKLRTDVPVTYSKLDVLSDPALLVYEWVIYMDADHVFSPSPRGVLDCTTGLDHSRIHVPDGGSPSGITGEYTKDPPAMLAKRSALQSKLIIFSPLALQKSVKPRCWGCVARCRGMQLLACHGPRWSRFDEQGWIQATVFPWLTLGENYDGGGITLSQRFSYHGGLCNGTLHHFLHTHVHKLQMTRCPRLVS